ncbi:hypothetical protein LCGC14_2969890, partial [marine sediment metagenome]
LWVTDPMLPRGLELLEAWGFRYKTVGFYWVKLNKNSGFYITGGMHQDPSQICFSEKDFFTGLGYWTRANPEQCLLGTRGHPRRLAKDVPRLVVAPRREHSRKPAEVRKRIERLLSGPYLELFARERAPGWDAWGDEVGLFRLRERVVRRKKLFQLVKAGAVYDRYLNDETSREEAKVALLRLGVELEDVECGLGLIDESLGGDR